MDKKEAYEKQIALLNKAIAELQDAIRKLYLMIADLMEKK